MMKAYQDLLAIKARQNTTSIFATDPIDNPPTSPMQLPGDKSAPVAELSKDEIQFDVNDGGSVLGAGAYGCVYKGRCRSIAVAVKVIKGFDPKSREQFMKEAALLSTIYHPNICLFLGACFGPPLMLVSELLENGDLDRLLKSAHGKEPSLRFLLFRMMRDVSRGMCWLHDRPSPILHRDLKPANVLIDSRWGVKLCDFGLSEVLTYKMGRDEPGQVKGTPLWLAPEMLDKMDFTTAADVYSFGIMLWQCVSREAPWSSVKDLRVLKNLVCEKQRRPVIPPCSALTQQLIESCWQHTPSQRPRFSEILTQLDSLLVELAIEDDNAAAFWRKHFAGREFVKWSQFQPAMESFLLLQEQKEMPGYDLTMLCLQTVLGSVSLRSDEASSLRNSAPGNSLSHSGGSKSPRLHPHNDAVNIEVFGRVLDWLGPWTHDFPMRTEELLRKPWFHGDVATEVAIQLVTGRPNGTFLVRFSNSVRGNFTVTRMSSKGVINLRIERGNDGSFRYKNSPGYFTLVDLLANEYQVLGITQHAPGSPYQRLFPNVPRVDPNYESQKGNSDDELSVDDDK